MKRSVRVMAIGIAVPFLVAGPAAAGDDPPEAIAPSAEQAPGSEVRVWLDVRSQFVSMFTQIPANVGLAAAVDFPAPVRAEIQIVAHPVWEGFQATLSAGVPFHLYDGRGRGGSTLQLKLPLQLAFGYLRATWEAKDGYDDRVSWLLLGPTLGLDFTWWVRESLGVCFAAGGSYLFRIADPGSEYGGGDDDAYSNVHHKLGLGELVLSFGLAFD